MQVPDHVPAQLVRGAAHLRPQPSGVHEGVVVLAQQRRVVHIGQAPVGPVQHVVRLGPRSGSGAAGEGAAPVPPPQPPTLRPREQAHHPPQVEVLPGRAEHVRDQRRVTRHPAQHLRGEQHPGRGRPQHLTRPGHLLQVAQADRHVQHRRAASRTLATLAVRIQPRRPAAHLGQRLHPPLTRRAQVPRPGRLVRDRLGHRPDRRLEHRRLLRGHHQLVLGDVTGRHPRLRQPRHAHQPLLQVIQLPGCPVPRDHRRAQPAQLTRTPRRAQLQQRPRHRRHRARLQARLQPGHLTQSRQRQTRRHRPVLHPGPHQTQRRARVRLRRGIRRQRPRRPGHVRDLRGQPRHLTGTALPQRRRILPHPRLRVQPRPRHHTPPDRLHRHLSPNRRRPRRQRVRLTHHHGQLLIRRLVHHPTEPHQRLGGSHHRGATLRQSQPPDAHTHIIIEHMFVTQAIHSPGSP